MLRIRLREARLMKMGLAAVFLLGALWLNSYMVEILWLDSTRMWGVSLRGGAVSMFRCDAPYDDNPGLRVRRVDKRESVVWVPGVYTHSEVMAEVFPDVSWTLSSFIVPLWLPTLCVGVLFAYLVVRGSWIRHGCCRQCGYNLTGNVSGRCPECGLLLDAEEANKG